MLHYDRIFPAAVIVCLAAGVAEYAQARELAGLNPFVAVAMAIGLDSRLRRSGWIGEAGSTERWQRQRTPI